MFVKPSAEMIETISTAVDAAQNKRSVLDLYSVVNDTYAAHEAENIALEDIAQLVIAVAAARNVSLILHSSWNVPPGQVAQSALEVESNT